MAIVLAMSSCAWHYGGKRGLCGQSREQMAGLIPLVNVSTPVKWWYYKMMVKVYKDQELPKLLPRGRSGPLSHSVHLSWIWGQFFLLNHEFQKSDRRIMDLTHSTRWRTIRTCWTCSSRVLEKKKSRCHEDIWRATYSVYLTGHCSQMPEKLQEHLLNQMAWPNTENKIPRRSVGHIVLINILWAWFLMRGF